MNKKLLVVIPDYVSVIVKKGEVIPRYYNPGNVFNEVHIMMTNDDRPDPVLVQSMVGEANLFIHNHPDPKSFFKKTLGWQPFLMEKWAESAVKIAQRIQPDLIRCHGIHLNAFLGAKIKEKLRVPLVTSIHTALGIDDLGGRLAKNWKERIIGYCQERLGKLCLNAMDHVIAVYSPIAPYLVKHKIKHYSIIHNTVGIGVKKKTNFYINPTHIKLLCVSRQTHLEKDPSHIIKAISSMQNVYLTLVGDGDLHDKLVDLAESLGCSNRIKFIKGLDNKDLLTLMREMDLYVYHSVDYEISKTCIEAALVGLPIILNDRNGEPAQEIKDAGFYLVKGSKSGYRDAIEQLIKDEELRINLARDSHHYAQQNWSPKITEQKVVNLYKSLLNS